MVLDAEVIVTAVHAVTLLLVLLKQHTHCDHHKCITVPK